MAKIFKTDEELEAMIKKQFAEVGLESIGLNLRVMSLAKSKDPIKVSKASPSTEFLAKEEDIVQVFVYEDVFFMLENWQREMLVEMALSNVSFDSEKEKINIESNPFTQVFAMRAKYGEKFMNTLEASYLAIKQIEDNKKTKGNEDDMSLEQAGLEEKK